MTGLSQPAGPRLHAEVLAPCVLVVVAPQLFGGAFAWSVVAIAVLSVLAVGVSLTTGRGRRRLPRDAVAMTMMGAWLYTCIQAAPLPRRIARSLRLGSVDNADRLAGLAWVGDVPATISYDPGATRTQILVGIAILSAFSAARLAGRAGLRPILGATVVSAVILGLEGLVHEAAQLDAVFGIYAPRFARAAVLTPLMNANHLGGVASVGSVLAAGLALDADTRGKRLWSVASVFCGLVVAATLSRGAIGSLLFGFVLLGLWSAGGRAEKRSAAAMPTALAAATTAGAVLFVGLEPLLRPFETQGLEKLAVAAQGLHLLEGPNTWLGVGRGAFSSMFVSEAGSVARHTHPENLVVQWSTEWGLVVALTLLVVLGGALWRRLRATTDVLVAAGCIAVFALTLQNQVDFSLEMAGVAVVGATLLGTLLPGSSRTDGRVATAPILTLLAVFSMLVIWLGPRAIREDPQSLIDELTLSMSADDDVSFKRLLRTAVAAHPGEPTFALLAGSYAGQRRHEDGPRWLAITMEQAPGWAAPHVVTAQWLLEAGLTDQALIEIREAEQRHLGSGTQELCTILRQRPEMEVVERAAPGDDRRIDYLDKTARCSGIPRELVEQIDSEILQDDPERATAILRQAGTYLRTGRFQDAVTLLDQAIERAPGDDRLWAAAVKARLSAGDPAGAKAALERSHEHGIESRATLVVKARVEAALGDAESMRATVMTLRGSARGDTTTIARSFILEGQLEATLGNTDRAIAAYEAGDRAMPESPALQYAAELARASGRLRQSLRFYRTLCRRKPGNPACARAEELVREGQDPTLRVPHP